MRRHALIVLCSFVAAMAAAQTPYLVKDINSSANANAASSAPSNFFAFGSRVYFGAGVASGGAGLWATDGTESGTRLILQTDLGPSNVLPKSFADVNGKLIFNAFDARGEELWMTDGTADGTRVMADINTGNPSSAPGDRVVYRGRMYFSADDGANGRELWVTDGTPAGTHLFKDLEPGPNGGSPRAFAVVGNTLYFAAESGLWKSNGTEPGTVLVAPATSAAGLVVVGSRIFFKARQQETGLELWVSDGTGPGTRIVADIASGAPSSFESNPLFPFGDGLLFFADDKQHGRELWISDGTQAGTRMLRDINPGPSGSSSYFGSVIAVLGGVALFGAETPEAGRELWRTDGTSAGTEPLRDIVPGRGSSGATNFLTVGDKVYFAATTGQTAQIWVSNGTDAGTRPITSPDMMFTIASRFTHVDGTLYFSAADGLHGLEPWKTDGTAGGTTMIANLAPDAAPASQPRIAHAADDYLYFDAWDGGRSSNSSQLRSFWRSDGTPEGTVRIGEFVPASYSATSVGRFLFFQNASTDGGRLWISDGTAEGTRRATEFVNRFPESPSIRFVMGDTIFAESAGALWATRAAAGSPALPLGSGDSYTFANVAGRAHYFTSSSNSGSALWSSDGTRPGTWIVRGMEGRSGINPVVLSGQLFFTRTDGRELWKSDGSADGTSVVTTFPQQMNRLVVAGTKIYFTEASGRLWVSDGTAEGTHALPIVPSSQMAVAGKYLVFVASDGSSGYEPWATDGTVEGTRMLRDIYPGPSGSSVNELTRAGDHVYFYAYSPEHGGELWRTDGTAEGTVLAADIEPGTAGSRPQQLTAAGGRLFFTATTSATGEELWALDLSATPRVVVNDVRVTEPDSGTVTARFVVTLTSPAPRTTSVEYATSDGTAVEGSDYDAVSGTLTFGAGETVQHVDVAVPGDGVAETNETFAVTFREAGGRSLTATAIIEDDDRTADVTLSLDFSRLNQTVLVEMGNQGPTTATNLRTRITAVPYSYAPDGCWDCSAFHLPPDARHQAFSYSERFKQQYLTAMVEAREPDPDPSNNSVGWTTNNGMAMNALHLSPGSEATVFVYAYDDATSLSIESSDPAIVAVPATAALPADAKVFTFLARGGSIGTATIRASAGSDWAQTLAIDVIAPGTKRRYPDAIRAYASDWKVRFGASAGAIVYVHGNAPFTGELPTGAFTITANGREVTRIHLTGDATRIPVPFELPEIGKYALTLHYEGDENFLPVTSESDMEVVRAYTTIDPTAARYGSSVIVRVRITGSPGAPPTGSFTVGTREAGGTISVPLAPRGPGAYGELTLRDVPPSTDTLVIRYSGDDHYLASQQEVRITGTRRPAARH